MAEREITEWKEDESGKIKPVVVTYEVKEKYDDIVLIKKEERDWDPEKDN